MTALRVGIEAELKIWNRSTKKKQENKQSKEQRKNSFGKKEARKEEQKTFLENCVKQNE